MVRLEIDQDLLDRSWATAAEEGLQWNQYVLVALRERVSADNLARAAAELDDEPPRRPDPGE